jgi:hypothetical protein
MKRLILFPICFVALAVPVVVLASGAQGGFDGVVSSIETRYHVHAQRIPFLGLISLISHKATNGGVNGMHVAEIEDFHADVDGDELNRMVQQKLGSEWERVIRESSRKDNCQTMIYMHPEGQRMGLFVLDLDGHEMNVVQVSVDPNHLSENIGKYGHHHRDDGDHDDDSD